MPTLSSPAVTALDWLVEERARAVKAVVEAVERGAGEKLVGVAVVGAWVPPIWRTVTDRVELLVVLTEAPMFVLGNLAHQVRQQVASAGVGLVAMTERELLRATDVFTLELADYEARHRVVLGRDPLVDLHFTPGELRLAIERRLRFLARDVRATMLTGVWYDGRPAEVRSVLRGALTDLLTVSHHLARLDGVDPVPSEDVLIDALAVRAGVESTRLSRIAEHLRGGQPFERPIEALGEVLELVDAATRVVDAMGVSTE